LTLFDFAVSFTWSSNEDINGVAEAEYQTVTVTTVTVYWLESLNINSTGCKQ